MKNTQNVPEKSCEKELHELRKDIENCQKCNTALLNMKNYPFKKGYEWIPCHVKVMFIGQSPPKSGKYIYDNPNEKFAKEFLKLLKAAELIKNTELQDFVNSGFYFTDIIKCPNGKIKHCKNFLIREIRILEPEIICTLGKKPLTIFTKRKNLKLKKYAGKFIQSTELDHQTSLEKTIFSTYFPTTYPISNKTKIKHFKKLKHYLTTKNNTPKK